MHIICHQSAMVVISLITCVCACPPVYVDGRSESCDVTSLLGGADKEQQRRSGKPAGALQERGSERRATKNHQPRLCECFLSLSYFHTHTHTHTHTYVCHQLVHHVIELHWDGMCVYSHIFRWPHPHLLPVGCDILDIVHSSF